MDGGQEKGGQHVCDRRGQEGEVEEAELLLNFQWRKGGHGGRTKGKAQSKDKLKHGLEGEMDALGFPHYYH